MGIYGDEYFHKYILFESDYKLKNDESNIIYNIPRQNINDIKFIYGKNGIQNAIINIKNIKNCDGLARFRAQNIVFNGNKIFCVKKENGLDFPGGSIEKGETPEDAACRETKEEALINSSQISYKSNYLLIRKEPKEWVKKYIPKKYQWKNYYTEIFTSIYIGNVSKNSINEIDRDNEMVAKGKWYNIEEIINLCNDAEKEAIKLYTEKISI